MSYNLIAKTVAWFISLSLFLKEHLKGYNYTELSNGSIIFRYLLFYDLASAIF